MGCSIVLLYFKQAIFMDDQLFDAIKVVNGLSCSTHIGRILYLSWWLRNLLDTLKCFGE
uniref:Uncharacterized protein n=1 Tax=Nelumbo nucifera TaxID=4432 RepID=A0A822Z052_NELNU|nr:TPA_asm: hypothetical protein HUJ06_007520 [Nelumbo nucifera]